MADKGDFTNINAFFWSDEDLSSYAGSDAGNAHNRIEVEDGAGKKAIGYIGAVGAGETLDSELVSNGGMETGDPPTGWGEAYGACEVFERSAVQKHGGDYSLYIEDTVPSWDGARSPVIPRTQGRLYKTLFWDYIVEGSIAVRVYDGPADTLIYNQQYTVTGSWQGDTVYFTEIETGDLGYILAINYSNEVSAKWYVDDISLKRVLDPPATAIHIVSSLNGTTRDWASIESGFDPNDIVDFNIYREAPGAFFLFFLDR